MNRRRFLRNSAGVLVPLSFGIIASAKGQANFRLQQQIAAAGATAAAAGGNNIALVGSQKGGFENSGASDSSFAMPGNVTNGNVVVVCAFSYFSGTTHTFVSGDITKTAGTATIGTPVVDQSVTGLLGVCIVRVPITGTGSLTLQIATGTEGTDTCIICAEFSGFNASPLDTGSTGSGTTNPETTGSITSSATGVIINVGMEDTVSDWTRTVSDQIIFSVSTGHSALCGFSQYKLITASPNELTSNKSAAADPYVNAWQMYKSS